jgi:hypothetical protein
MTRTNQSQRSGKKQSQGKQKFGHDTAGEQQQQKKRRQESEIV